MAKQSGLHQIRGKVGEYSYYRQTGVASGLLRGINQGLSSRVKTGDEYANTRLNNAEFGAACNVAGELGKMVTPKYRPMILPFSQSKMAKFILELAKSHAGLWGRRAVTADDTPEMAQILTRMSKLDVNDFMSLALARGSASTATLDVTMTVSQVQQMIDLGIDGFDYKSTLYLLRSGQYSDTSDKILRSSLRAQYSETITEELSAGDPLSSDVTLTVGAAPVLTNMVNHRFVTVVIMPFRIINNVKYTLQEYCMFVTYQLPETE